MTSRWRPAADLHADRARRPHRAGTGGGAMLVDYKTGAPPGTERSPGRLRAAADAGGGDARARRLRRGERRRAVGALYLKLGGAKGGESARTRLQGRRPSARSPNAISRTRCCCSSNSRDADDALSVAARSRNSPGASAITTISRGSRNGRRPAGRRGERRMSARRDEIPARRRRAQAQRLRSRASAWVSANAGSGKTHVLAQRVAAPAARRRAARAHSVPDLHQGGGGQYGRAACSRRSRHGRSSTTRSCARPSSSSARRRPIAARPRLRAAAVRAHHRDAGRPEDPDHPRLLRAAAAPASRSRPMSPPAFAVADEREAALLLDRARARRARRRLRRRAPGGEACRARRREAGGEGFDKLLREASGACAREISEALLEGDDLGGFGELLAARARPRAGRDGSRYRRGDARRPRRPRAGRTSPRKWTTGGRRGQGAVRRRCACVAAPTDRGGAGRPIGACSSS